MIAEVFELVGFELQFAVPELLAAVPHFGLVLADTDIRVGHSVA